MKFILTKELGRLAKWLRILGFDAVYFKPDNLSSLIITALREERIILTRNQRLSRPSGVKVVFVEAQRIREQIAEIAATLKIRLDPKMMFSRCILCNEALTGITREEANDKVPEYVYNTQKEFVVCPKCARIYWRGTHWGNVADTLKELI